MIKTLVTVVHHPRRSDVRLIGTGRTDTSGGETIIAEFASSISEAVARAATLREITPEVDLQVNDAELTGPARPASRGEDGSEEQSVHTMWTQDRCSSGGQCKANGELAMNRHTPCTLVKRHKPKRRRRILAVGSTVLILAAPTPPTWQTALWKTVAGQVIEHGANVAWRMIKDVLTTKPPLPDLKVAARPMERPTPLETHDPRAITHERSGNKPGPGRCGRYGGWSTVEQACKDTLDK